MKSTINGKVYAIGEKVLCKFHDNTYANAEIIDIQSADQANCEESKEQDDKRLDKWVTESDLRPLSQQQKVALTVVDLEKSKIITRGTKRKMDVLYPQSQELTNLPPDVMDQEKKYQEKTKIRNIEKIILGMYEINTWYYSPFPEEYGKQKVLYICEKCLKYLRKKSSIIKHRSKCTFKSPPGKPIYHDKLLKLPNESEQVPYDAKSITIYEIDGAVQKRYCQCLCLMAKLFLDHKTLYYDISSFMFYVLCEDSKAGSIIAGYFSKDKAMAGDNNLSCFMVLPPYQCKGYGKLLISLSYHLSKEVDRICGPEKPLSDMGKICYKSYWTDVLLRALREHRGNLSIKELSDFTMIRESDIIFTLQELNLVKYCKGQYILSTVHPKVIDQHFKEKEEKMKQSKRQVMLFKPELVNH